jgi:hypothetical protein
MGGLSAHEPPPAWADKPPMARCRPWHAAAHGTLPPMARSISFLHRGWKLLP